MTLEVPANAEPLTFAEAYRRKLADGWESDAAQQSAVSQLSQLLAALRRDEGKPPSGLYLHGPVGRGKSQLLSLFMQYVPGAARRTHMHAFMGEVHARLHGLKGSDPIKLLSKEMAGEFRLLGFGDEDAWMLVDSGADLQLTRSLIGAGCPLHLALRIAV